MRNLMRTSCIAAALALLVGAIGVADAAAQTGVPTREAQAFVGKWTLAVDAQGQSFNLDLSIEDASGNLAAEVSSQMGTTKVDKISKNGEKLVLSYDMDAQGQVIPVAITLTPNDAGLNADLDFAGGMFTATGKGTKK